MGHQASTATQTVAPVDGKFARKRASEQFAARLDYLLEAGRELAALAEIAARHDEPTPRGNAGAGAREALAVVGEALSLSLPYVPSRLVVEVSGPAGTGQLVGDGGGREAVGAQLALVRDTASARAARPEVTG